ncbi:MAG: cache domain-containing protein [Syntrophales bacterium]
MFKKVMISIFICLFVVTSLYAAEKRATPAEAKKLVEKAAAFVAANGEEKALKEFNTPKGEFVKGDLYVFAFDPKGVLLANVNLPKLVGTNLYNEPDSKGKLNRKEYIDLANSQGSGWVEYYQVNPKTKKQEAKISYVQKVGNIIVGCGAYLP